jgi:flagella basal body P-ring formation protein FlgA
MARALFQAEILALLLLASPALAAPTLRQGDVTLSTESVRLSDLFQDVERDRVIGPAPDPGGRIVVESAQLAAIARQFGVDWRPATTADRIVMERPGRAFPRAPVMRALRVALTAAGIPPNSEVETPALTLPMVPPNDTARPDVTEAAYDPASGRFTALLSITADGMKPFNARMSGHVQEMVDLQVVTRHMNVGDVIGNDDLQPAHVRAGLARSEPARTPDDAIGMAVQRPLNAGSPVLLADLARPMMVMRGANVQVQLNRPGLSVTIQGVAMESAALGDPVQVLNPTSRSVMTAAVTGTSTVRVDATSAPIQLSPGAPVPPPPVIRPARLAGR